MKLVICLFVLNCFLAQEYTGRLILGLNLNKLRVINLNEELKDILKQRNGIYVGAELFAEKSNLSLSIAYENKAYTIDIDDPNGFLNFNVNYNYLTFTLMYNLTMIENLTVLFGPSAAFLLKEEINLIKKSPNVSLVDDAEKADNRYSLKAGVSIDFKPFHLRVVYDFAVNSIYPIKPPYTPDRRIHSLQLYGLYDL